MSCSRKDRSGRVCGAGLGSAVPLLAGSGRHTRRQAGRPPARGWLVDRLGVAPEIGEQARRIAGFRDRIQDVAGRPEGRVDAGCRRARYRSQFQPNPFSLLDQPPQRSALPRERRARADRIHGRRERGSGALQRRRIRRARIPRQRTVGIRHGTALGRERTQRPCHKRDHRLYQRPCRDQPRLVQRRVTTMQIEVACQ